MNMDKNIQEVPIEDIIPNRFQPRLSFNEEGLNELSDSIKQHGIIQPLVVRKLGDKFEIVAGERRYKAAVQAGLTKVPVILSDVDDNQSAEVALVENIQRRNLTAIEEAKSYKNLLDRGYLTQEQLASKMGVSQSSISNKLRLLNLDEEVQDALLNEKISERHARALLSIENKEEQKKWLKRIIEERMTVRQLDMELKRLTGNNGEEDEGIPLVSINPNIDDIVNNAEDINVVREPHDVASMLIPEGGVKEEPKEEEPKQPEKMPNKFFNFLEDEEANMNVMEPDEILNNFQEEEISTTTPVEEPKQLEPEIEKLEILDDLDLEEDTLLDPTEPTQAEPVHSLEDIFSSNQPLEIEEPITSPVQEGIENPNIADNAPEQEPITEQTISNEIEEVNQNNQPKNEEISPFKSIFFNNEEETSTTPVETTPIINNTIEEVIPVVEEKLVDPMDSVVTLEPDYEARQEELAGTDLKTAINVVRDTVENLEKRGFTVESEEADLEDLYHITIKIMKK